jgi:fatty acid amide hydrolase 2
MEALLRMSAVQLAERIADRRLSSVEVVQAHIDEVCRWNPVINALVATRFDSALEEARAADARTKQDPDALGPLHGVPCTVKEAVAFGGMPHSSGLLARADKRAEADAPTVARLRQAGAIPLGVTNVSELCMWMECDNKVYGCSSNPYDAGRTPGGSSGGEGAIVGAGASPIGLGADVGGSIRMPAFFCGVFGHKPTGGLVPATGHHPLAEGAAQRYLTIGPLARCAEDLMPFLRVIAGPDGSYDCVSYELGDPDAVRIEGLRVINVVDNGSTHVSEELQAAQRRAADHLASSGASVRTVEVPALARSFEIWGAMMAAANHTPFIEHLGDGAPISVGREMLRFMMGRSSHTFPALMLGASEQIPMLRGRRGQRLVEAGRELREQLESLLGDGGVMLYPSYATVAPRHREPLRWPFRWVYTGIINVMELPATQVPLGLGEEGLPLGVQVVGRRGNDHLTIAIARELERAFGGWVPPHLD